jgi:hypothetical protein
MPKVAESKKFLRNRHGDFTDSIFCFPFAFFLEKGRSPSIWLKLGRGEGGNAKAKCKIMGDAHHIGL